MKLEDKNVPKKSRKSSISIVMYVAASVIALVGIAALVNNILLFRSSVNQYVAEGYPAATVLKQLIPMQLLPGIFESIGMYGGIAFILLGVGMVNKKISKYLVLLSKANACNDATEESILKQSFIAIETTEQTKTPEELKLI